MLEKIKGLLTKAHEHGIPIPMVRDFKNKGPSVSLTLLLISFGVVLFGLIGKWSKLLSVDTDQAIYLFGICAGLYFSRNVGGSGKVNLGESVNEEKKKEE